jgi:hypothetical protein
LLIVTILAGRRQRSRVCLSPVSAVTAPFEVRQSSYFLREPSEMVRLVVQGICQLWANVSGCSLVLDI